MALPGLTFEVVAPARAFDLRGDRVGLVALAERGPIEAPTVVRSREELRDLFGRVSPGMLGVMAGELCFANGAEEIFVCRAAPVRGSDLARVARAELPRAVDGGTLELEATEPGAFANDLEVIAEARIARTLTGALVAPTTFDSVGFVPDDRGRVLRLFMAGRDRWARITAVAGSTVTFFPAVAGPLPVAAAAQVFDATFALRIREPGRPEQVVSGLDLRDPAAMRARLRGAPITVVAGTVPSVDLPMPGAVARLDGGADGIRDVADDEANRAALVDAFRRAMAALVAAAEPDIVIAPDLWSRIWRSKGVHALALDGGRARSLADELVQATAERGDRVVLVDPPLAGRDGVEPLDIAALRAWRAEHAIGLGSARDFAATFAPWTRLRSPVSFRGDETMLFPPSALVAGRMARTSLQQAPWIATGNVAIEGAVGLSARYDTAEQEQLAELGINPLAMRAPEGAVIGGVRGLAWPDRRPWLFLSTRRLFNVLRRILPQVGRSYVFEPNTAATWLSLRRDLQAVLLELFRRGAFAGAVPDQAFVVQVDETLNPPDVRDLGELHARIAVAPAIPLEFIHVRLVLGATTTKVVEE